MMNENNLNIAPGWSTASMVMYVVMGLYAAVSIHYLKKNRQFTEQRRVSIWNIYYIPLMFVLNIIASFRYVGNKIGGTDSPGYIDYFINCLTREEEHFELGFIGINKFIRLFSSDYHVFYLICYGFIICSFLMFINEFMTSKTSTIPFILLIFELWRGFDTFRTTLALAFVLYGLVWLKQGRTKTAVIFTVMSTFVHTSAIVYALFLPFYYLYKKEKIKFWHGIFASAIFYMAVRILQNFLLSSGAELLELIDTGAMAGYIRKSLNESIFQFNMINIEHGLLFVFILIYGNKIKKSIDKRNDEEKKRINLLLLICYFDFLTIPINFVLGAWRGYEFLYVPRLVMWGELIGIFKSGYAADSRWIFDIVFVVIFISWLVFRIYNMWESGNLMPYIFEPFVNLKYSR